MAKKKRSPPDKKKSNKLVYAGLVVLVVVALAVYLTSNPVSEKIPEKLPTAGKYVKIDKPSTYESGKVKMIEFLKFNCGHCYSLNQKMPEIKQKYGDKLEVTYKPMLWRAVPQDQGFRKSIEAYILAERMGQGTNMSDALFKAMFVDKRDITSEITLEEIGANAGLGIEFVTALKNGDAKNEAEANINLAESFKVDETPTVIINGNLKVTPSMTNGDMAAMINNINTIIASFPG